MPLYFVQHGLAESKEVNPDRPLSEKGHKEVEHISACLRNADLSVRKIYHSGKLRARQTALILAEHIGDGTAHELAGMNPNDDVQAFAGSLNEDDALYVGHLPHLGRLVSYLTAGEENRDVLSFTNGSVACLEKDDSGCHIAWFVIPSMCIAEPR